MVRRGCRGFVCYRRFVSLVVCFIVWKSLNASQKRGETNALLQEIVDLVLEPWERVRVSKRVVEKAFYEVGNVQDAACFMLQNIEGQMYSIGDEDKREIVDTWNPGRLFRTRRQNIIKLLTSVNNKYGLPNFEATFCLHDCVVSQDHASRHNYSSRGDLKLNDPIPAFTVVACRDSMNIPFPTWDYATGFFGRWGAKIQALKRYSSQRPWRTRRSVAVFRGGQRSCVLYPTVGERRNGTAQYRVGVGDSENAKKCGRNALIYQALTSEHAELFDVALTDGINPTSFGHKLRKPPDTPTQLSKQQQEEYRYQILAEGECQWANRLRDALFSGSALIIQENSCVEYYGLGLKAWEHYIPVDYWFTNLTDAVLWAERNVVSVEEMISRKQQYAEDVLNPSRVYEYIYQLFTSYARLLDYDSIKVRQGAVKIREAFLPDDPDSRRDRFIAASMEKLTRCFPTIVGFLLFLNFSSLKMCRKTSRQSQRTSNWGLEGAGLKRHDW